MIDDNIYTRVESICAECGMIFGSSLPNGTEDALKAAKSHNVNNIHTVTVNLVSRLAQFNKVK